MDKSTFVCNSLDFNTYIQFIRSAVMGSGRSHSTEFRAEIARYFDISEESVFLFGSGRMGLYVALKASGIGPGDEVIIPGYTCVVVPNAVKYLGARVTYVDISEETLNIDTEKLVASISSSTKAIIITHNFGIAYEDIEYIRRHCPQVAIIEDAAHAVGTVTSDGIKVGLKGNASFFSLEYSKPLTTGIGGFLIVNDPGLQTSVGSIYATLGEYPRFEILKMMLTLFCLLITSYNWAAFIKSPLFRALTFFRLIFQTSPREIAGEMPSHYPVKLSSVQACLGSVQLKNIADSCSIRKIIGQNYFDALKNISGLQQYYSDRYTFVRYPLVFDKGITSQRIRSLRNRIESEADIATGEWFNDVVHPKGSLRYCYIEGSCPVGESIATRIINLPVSTHDIPSQAALDALRRICGEELGINEHKMN